MVKRGEVRDSVSLNFTSTITNSNKKSQAAVEIIIILAFILIILLALISLNQDLMDSFSGQLNANKAKITVNDLGDAAQQVYQQGVGAQTRVFVTIPKGVSSSSISDHTLRITLGEGGNKRDVYRNVDFQIAGNIPMQQGNHWITVKSRQGYVVIGFAIVDILPGGYSKTYTPGNSSVELMSISNTLQEQVDVSITYTFDSEISISFIETDFLLSAGEDKNLLVTLSALASTEAGVYTGEIQIDANTTTESQTSFIPVTITVDSPQSCTACPSILMFPQTWNLGIFSADDLTSQQFHVCNNLGTAQSVSFSFSNNTYVGFDSAISSKTSSMNIGAQDCNSTTVYINTTGAGTGPYLTYLTADTGTYSDSSVIMLTIGVDSLPPVINLVSPADNSTSVFGNMVFAYNVSDFASNVDSCDLIINDTVMDTDTSIQEEIEQSFTIIGLINGYYKWGINCTDDAPASNEGSSELRYLFINFTSVTATPELAFEEDYDPQWTTEVQTIGDGFYATALDEGPPVHANYPPPDYVEFDFPNLGISDAYGIESVVFSMRHYENLDGGWFDADERHEIECYNGVSWETVDVWDWTPETNMTWIYYISPDLSSCISTASVANDIHIRVEYDPADETGAEQYIDWAQVEVNISTAYYINLWELILDDPQPLDFSSGLNTTNNTFGILFGNDGWDWEEDPYGGAESATEFNIDPNMDGDISDSTVAVDGRLEIRIGDGAPGGQDNSDDDSYNGPAASGAYGVEFNITSEMYSKISGGKAQLSFDWYADQDAGWGNGMDAGDEAWIKARLITPSTTVWLGSDLDSGDNDADPYNEIWFMNNPSDDFGHENIDITSYITTEGIYYFDLGIAVGDWDNGEGFGGYFDNIMILIIG